MGVGRRQSCPLADALEKPADGIRREWAAAGCLRAENLLQLVYSTNSVARVRFSKVLRSSSIG